MKTKDKEKKASGKPVVKPHEGRAVALAVTSLVAYEPQAGAVALQPPPLTEAEKECVLMAQAIVFHASQGSPLVSPGARGAANASLDRIRARRPLKAGWRRCLEDVTTRLNASADARPAPTTEDIA